MKAVANTPNNYRKKRNCSLSLTENKDQRSIANIRERQRTHNLNLAFANLKERIPTMSTDKLSKIQTLKIAKKYIQFLICILEKESTEKYQSADELRKAFGIWRMDNEQINQVTSSSDFLEESLNENFNSVVQQFNNNNLQFFSR